MGCSTMLDLNERHAINHFSSKLNVYKKVQLNRLKIQNRHTRFNPTKLN